MSQIPEHAETPISSVYGNSVMHCFSWSPHEEDNLLVVACGSLEDSPLIRVQSACYTAEIFRSTDCDCHEQLDRSLELVHAEGGAVIYMLCDGRGAGLLTKFRGLALGASEGLDTAEAYERLGVDLDPRNYERVAHVLRTLGVRRLRLLTNNPRKIAGLEDAGLQVVPEPLLIAPTAASLPYLEAKRDKLGHTLKLDKS